MYSVVQHVASEQKLGGHNSNEQLNKYKTNHKDIVLDLKDWVELNLTNILKISFNYLSMLHILLLFRILSSMTVDSLENITLGTRFNFPACFCFTCRSTWLYNLGKVSK